MMRKIGSSFFIACAWLVAGCVDLPPEEIAKVYQAQGIKQSGVNPASNTPGHTSGQSGSQANASWGTPARSSSAAAASATDPQITTTLVYLAENGSAFHVDLSQSQGTPIADILALGSPTGYALRTRYLNIGIPLGEALSRNMDAAFQERLIQLARWDRGPEVRAQSLIILAASAHDPSHFQIFNEALGHLDPAIRFGALEALGVWGHPDKAIPLLNAAAEKETEPILRVYAASVLARLGDANGLARLRTYLDDASWLVRAMAARYLGDMGTAGDYDLLAGRISRETQNDFVAAEYCIAALKLFSKKSP